MVYYSTLGFIFVPKMRLPSHHSFRIFPYKPSIVGYPIYENPELAAVVNLLQFLPELFGRQMLRPVLLINMVVNGG